MTVTRISSDHVGQVPVTMLSEDTCSGGVFHERPKTAFWLDPRNYPERYDSPDDALYTMDREGWQNSFDLALRVVRWREYPGRGESYMSFLHQFITNYESENATVDSIEVHPLAETYYTFTATGRAFDPDGGQVLRYTHGIMIADELHRRFVVAYFRDNLLASEQPDDLRARYIGQRFLDSVRIVPRCPQD